MNRFQSDPTETMPMPKGLSAEGLLFTYNVHSQPPPNTAQDKRHSEQWRCQVAEWEAYMAPPAGLIDGMWSSGMKVPFDAPRVRALLDLVATERLMCACADQQITISEIKEFSQEKKQALLKNVFCDISQNPKFRSCTGPDGVTGCLTTSSSIYSYGKDRMVLPFELMLFQGHRRGLKIPQKMKSSSLRSLAGEGMAVPCLGAIIWSLYLTKGLP